MNTLLRDLNQNLFDLQKAKVFMNSMSEKDLEFIEFHILKESMQLREFYNKINEQGISSLSDMEIKKHEDRCRLISKVTKAFCPSTTMKLVKWEKELAKRISLLMPQVAELKSKGHQSSVNMFNYDFEITQFGKTIFSTSMKTMDQIFHSFSLEYDESFYLFIALQLSSESLETIRESYIFSEYLKTIEK